jgi:hypothetical protein
MNRPMLLTTAQGWSRILGALSAVPVIYWVIENWEQAEARTQGGGFVCGIGAVVLLFVCMACAGTLSLSAIALGVLSYSRVPKPRPTSRRIELVVVGHFFALGLLGYALLLAGKALG